MPLEAFCLGFFMLWGIILPLIGGFVGKKNLIASSN
jgi:hypothetical protein